MTVVALIIDFTKFVGCAVKLGNGAAVYVGPLEQQCCVVKYGNYTVWNDGLRFGF